jgi:hypothetical protein
MLLVSWFAAAAGDCHPPDCAGLAGPSNFDYLVLASIAYSPRPLAMASFRSSATPCNETSSCPAQDFDHITNKRVAKCRSLLG